MLHSWIDSFRLICPTRSRTSIIHSSYCVVVKCAQLFRCQHCIWHLYDYSLLCSAQYTESKPSGWDSSVKLQAGDRCQSSGKHLCSNILLINSHGRCTPLWYAVYYRRSSGYSTISLTLFVAQSITKPIQRVRPECWSSVLHSQVLVGQRKVEIAVMVKCWHCGEGHEMGEQEYLSHTFHESWCGWEDLLSW